MSVQSRVAQREADGPRWAATPRAAYVHVPFCARRCGYCDFTVVAGHDHLITEYLRSLRHELCELGQPRTVDTLYVGGGTPTQLNAAQLQQLMQLLQTWLPLAPGGEMTVEANPRGLDHSRLQVLLDSGVNRISLGVQSFVDRELAWLERDHTVQDLDEVLPMVRRMFDNVSLDLIFGIGGQSLDDWNHSLQSALRSAVDHVSAYGLTIEKGTSFWSRQRRGDLQVASDELQRGMYAAAMDRLSAGGLTQYEISSFARPRYTSRHNQVYWSGDSFWGFGPGAARYLGGCRETNHRSTRTWIKRITGGESAIADRECLSTEDRARERLVLGLRTCRGVCSEEFEREMGCRLVDLAGKEIEQHVGQGWLERSGSRIRLTRAGRFVADSVIRDML